jgi:alpha-tubulin suppressor-like RCC1 family protein
LGVLSYIISVSAGWDHACARTEEGYAYCWGSGANGQLGNNATPTTQSTPVQVVGVGGTGVLSDVTSVSAGGSTYGAHTCARTEQGYAYCWGYGVNGQLGNNATPTTQSTPVQVVGVGGTGVLSGVTSVSAGSAHTCARTEQGYAYCWGYGVNGRLGNNDTPTTQSTPVQVVGVGGTGVLSGVTSVSAGSAHTCARIEGGYAYCWGRGANGQLGNNATPTTQSTPVQVVGVGGTGVLSGVTSVSAGTSHTCARTEEGYAYCWGSGANGQLGNNATPTTQSTPVQVVGVGGTGVLSGVTSVSAGTSHTCARTEEGYAYCWGQGDIGRLGNNSTSSSSTPVQVVGVGGTGVLSGVTSVSAGSAHTCARTEEGYAYCWGSGTSGRLGNNDTAQSETPVQVVGVGGTGVLSGVTSVSAGSAHTCARTEEGYAYCWGSGTSGRLGNNDTAQSETPSRLSESAEQVSSQASPLSLPEVLTPAPEPRKDMPTAGDQVQAVGLEITILPKAKPPSRLSESAEQVSSQASPLSLPEVITPAPEPRKDMPTAGDQVQAVGLEITILPKAKPPSRLSESAEQVSSQASPLSLPEHPTPAPEPRKDMPTAGDIIIVVGLETTVSWIAQPLSKLPESAEQVSSQASPLSQPGDNTPAPEPRKDMPTAGVMLYTASSELALFLIIEFLRELLFFSLTPSLSQARSPDHQPLITQGHITYSQQSPSSPYLKPL